MKKYICLAIIIVMTGFVKAFAVEEYYLTCDPAQLQEIYNRYNEDIYIDATLTLNGKTWQDVQIRIHGQDTRSYPKKSLKVKFIGERFLDSIEEFNFNAEYGDKSYMRQYLTSRIMRESGMQCYKSSHARLYINGEYYGLFLKIEQVGKRFLRDRGFNDEGNLYKASLQNLSCLSKWDNIELGWEKKTNESQGTEDLVELIRKLDVEPDESFYNLMHDIFDYNQIINYLALNIVTANMSTYYHNYFMYNDMFGTKKWYILPWDMDKSLGVWWPDNQYNSSSSRPDNPIYEKSFIIEKIYTDVQNRVDEICNTVFNVNHLNPIIDSLIADLSSSVAEDTKDNIANDSVWNVGIGMNGYFISARYSKLKEQYPVVPRSFRVEPTEGTYTGDVKLTWHPCKYPENLQIKYRVTYSTDFYLLDTSKTKKIDNITDTSYTLKKGDIKEGLYYWKITAYTDKYEVDGYDNFNKFSFKNGTVLPCQVTENTTLNKQGSPYTIDCNLEVVKSAILTVTKGVELNILNNSQVDIKGTLRIEGTQDEPVIIKSISDDTTSNLITVNNGSGNSWIKFAVITNVFVHFLTSSDVLIEDSKFKFEKEIFKYSIHGSGCNFTMRRCSVSGHSTLLPEGMILLGTPYSDVEDSYFENIIDPVEYINVGSGYIKNNYITNSTDDGIDLNGGNEIVISGNRIYNSVDKGISIGNENFGGAKNIIIERNILVNNSMGIGIKDSAEAIVINNTFYNNNYGIKCYEKNSGFGGGFITVINSIIANSGTKSVDVDDKSIASVSYTLSNTDYLKDGAGNKKAEPQFRDPANNNFNLNFNSPCIDAGDPKSPKDPDGTRTDLGAIPFNTGKAVLVINEINYNSSSDFDSGDWIELYNPSEIDAEISDWYFSDSDNAHKFLFPKGTKIIKGEYLVLCRDKTLFSAKYPNVKNYMGNFEFGLSAAGDLLRLFNQAGEIVDSLTYDDKLPWPEEPDGNGPTLELISFLLDNSLPQSWKASATAHGTPGEQNSVFNDVDDSFISDGSILKASPNPFEDNFNIEFNLKSSSIISLGVYDINGRLVTSIIDNKFFDSGEYRFNIISVKLPQQLYYCKLESYYPNQFVICVPVVRIGN
ncbi:MAG: CotH kinase family protein [Ignavibacteriae bacterium]|nr:CotH kinase family protein [Ignavibacteriota bacterium]